MGARARGGWAFLTAIAVLSCVTVGAEDSCPSRVYRPVDASASGVISVSFLGVVNLTRPCAFLVFVDVPGLLVRDCQIAGPLCELSLWAGLGSRPPSLLVARMTTVGGSETAVFPSYRVNSSVITLEFACGTSNPASFACAVVPYVSTAERPSRANTNATLIILACVFGAGLLVLAVVAICFFRKRRRARVSVALSDAPLRPLAEVPQAVSTPAPDAASASAAAWVAADAAALMSAKEQCVDFDAQLSDVDGASSVCDLVSSRTSLCTTQQTQLDPDRAITLELLELGLIRIGTAVSMVVLYDCSPDTFENLAGPSGSSVSALSMCATEAFSSDGSCSFGASILETVLGASTLSAEAARTYSRSRSRTPPRVSSRGTAPHLLTPTLTAGGSASAHRSGRLARDELHELTARAITLVVEARGVVCRWVDGALFAAFAHVADALTCAEWLHAAHASEMSPARIGVHVGAIPVRVSDGDEPPSVSATRPLGATLTAQPPARDGRLEPRAAFGSDSTPRLPPDARPSAHLRTEFDELAALTVANGPPDRTSESSKTLAVVTPEASKTVTSAARPRASSRASQLAPVRAPVPTPDNELFVASTTGPEMSLSSGGWASSQPISFTEANTCIVGGSGRGGSSGGGGGSSGGGGGSATHTHGQAFMFRSDLPVDLTHAEVTTRLVADCATFGATVLTAHALSAALGEIVADPNARAGVDLTSVLVLRANFVEPLARVVFPFDDVLTELWQFRARHGAGPPGSATIERMPPRVRRFVTPVSATAVQLACMVSAAENPMAVGWQTLEQCPATRAYRQRRVAGPTWSPHLKIAVPITKESPVVQAVTRSAFFASGEPDKVFAHSSPSDAKRAASVLSFGSAAARPSSTQQSKQVTPRPHAQARLRSRSRSRSSEAEPNPNRDGMASRQSKASTGRKLRVASPRATVVAQPTTVEPLVATPTGLPAIAPRTAAWTEGATHSILAGAAGQPPADSTALPSADADASFPSEQSRLASSDDSALSAA